MLLVTCEWSRVISHVLFGGKNVLNDMMNGLRIKYHSKNAYHHLRVKNLLFKFARAKQTEHVQKNRSRDHGN